MGQPSYIEEFDTIMERRPPQMRILYIESDYPDVLDRVLDEKTGSIYLRRWLGISDLSGFEKACEKHAARPLAAVYVSANGLGMLKNTEYFKREYPVVNSSTEQTLELDKNGNPQQVYYKSPDGEYIRLSVNWMKDDPRKHCPDSVIELNAKKDQRFLVGNGAFLNFMLHRPKAKTLQDTPVTDNSCRFFYITRADALQEETLTQVIRAFLENSIYSKAKLVLTGTTRNIPPALADQVLLVRLGVPTFKDIRAQLTEKLSQQCTGKLPFTTKELDRMAEDLMGLTPMQLDQLYATFGPFLLEDLKEDKGNLSRAIWQLKEQDSQKDDTLIIEKIEKNPSVVGNGGFVQWLNEQLPLLADPSIARKLHIDPPSGIIFTGTPGTGKSMLAKQVAYLWSQYRQGQRPVSFIQFKIGNLSSSNYGESEARLEHFLAKISEQSPALLFIDEVEKTFFQKEGSQDMHEVKKSQMAMLLGWMQEHKETIFTVMTSNDISVLPSELIRSGRLSERFLVFLPSCFELMCMLYSFLRDKTEDNLFKDEFRQEIRNICILIDEYTREYGTDEENDRKLKQKLNKRLRESSLRTVFDALTEYAMNPRGDAKRNDEVKNGTRLWDKWLEEDDIPMRTLFLTGADLGLLVKNTMLRLLWKKKGSLEDWTAQDFVQAMKDCSCRPEFTPYGQSNLKKCVDLYLSCDYRNVSDTPLLPRTQFDVRKGTFDLGSSGYILSTDPDNLYDQYLQQTLRREIEKTASRKKRQEDHEDRQHRMTAAQEGFQQEQMDFQKQQMIYQRQQWQEEKQEKAARKQHEQNSYELTRLQLKKMQEE